MVGEVKLNGIEGGVSNGNLSIELEGKEICANGFVTAAKNGTVGDVWSAGSSGNIVRTYKRRRRTKTMEDEKLPMASSGHVNDQSAKEPCCKNLSGSSYMQSRLAQTGLHACVNDVKSCSSNIWRNVVLEQMSQTLECEGGLRGCIQDAVTYDLQSCSTAAVKGSVHPCEKESMYTSQTGLTLNNLHNEVRGNEGMVSDKPMQEPKSYTGKELCQRTFYEVIRSQKFSQLCHLLLKSFPGINSERVLDVSNIDSRMVEGSYENSPNLFHADIQQVWTKIEQIGTDMVALAKSLSVISRVSFCEQAGSVSLCSTEVREPDESDMNGKEDCIQFRGVYKACTCKNCGETADVRNCLVCDSCEEVHHIACIEPAIEEIPPGSWYCASCTANGMGSPHDDCVVCERMNVPISLNREGARQELENYEDMESDMNGKEDWIQFCAVYKACTCKNCGETADVKNCLVCDSCEEVYHIACIEPAIEEIPSGSWYCASCTANGMGSPHDDCVVCERMNVPISLNREGARQELENDEDMVTELEESSNGLLVDELQLKGGDNFPICIICRSAVIAGEKLKICHHPFCPHKFYHVPCLTGNQLKTYGRVWYCPSCLCRSCLTDQDDNKIVLCDGCDHAYHIYCMQPPLTSVPTGKWFCRICDADIMRLRQAKMSYGMMHHKLKKTATGGNGFLNGVREEETVDTMDKKPGAIDMILNAVKTLNNADDITTTLGLS